MRQISVAVPGGLEVLTVVDAERPEPGEGEVLVEVATAGVNFIDVYHRTGRYPKPLPFTPGVEGAGVVVGGPRAGERVASVDLRGAYAEYAVVGSDRAVAVPDAIDTETAAAVLLQGLTAHYLVHDSYALRAGDTVVVHAAAGGMGLLLTQLVTHLGGRVIGTASTPEKAKLAEEAGAEAVVGYDDLTATVRRVTGGAGVAAVYDGVGASTFEASLASLRPRGTFVSYGSASGAVPPVDPARLSAAGSVFFTRPTLTHFVADADELRQRVADVFGWVADGTLSVRVGGRYPLAEVAAAHRDLESRRTTGKLLLIP